MRLTRVDTALGPVQGGGRKYCFIIVFFPLLFLSLRFGQCHLNVWLVEFNVALEPYNGLQAV